MRSFNCGITFPLRLYVAGLAENRIMHVEVESDRVAANLHVPLFEDIEQADLNQLVQLRELVHRKDPSVHSRNESEVQRLFGRHARARRQLGRIDFANHVGELRTRGEPLGIAVVARPPVDRDLLFGAFGHEPLAGRGDRRERILMNRHAGQVEVGNLLVEKTHQEPHEPALGLPFLAQEQHVVPGDQGDIDLRNHRVFVADDARDTVPRRG